MFFTKKSSFSLFSIRILNRYNIALYSAVAKTNPKVLTKKPSRLEMQAMKEAQRSRYREVEEEKKKNITNDITRQSIKKTLITKMSLSNQFLIYLIFFPRKYKKILEN